MIFTVTITVKIEADDINTARCLANEFAERGNDSVDGEVGDVVGVTVEDNV